MRISAASSSNNGLPGLGRERGAASGLIGFKSGRSVFLFGFAKNERKNISNAELTTLREIAGSFLNATDEKITQALKDGTLIEVLHGNEDEKDESGD
jgi:hypothetical protein